MKRIDYYFHTNKNDALLKQLVSTPLFQQMIAYFRLQNGEPVLLRRLKEAITTDENIEYTLEKMIDYQLVERNERRYKMLMPIYAEQNGRPLMDGQTVTELNNFSEKLNQLELDAFLGEWLWESFFPKDVDYFFGIERDVESEGYFFNKIEIGNHELRFVSVQNEQILAEDLATYFSILKTNQIPTAFNPLHQLIGDIDLNYYISQVKRIIRNAEKHRKAGNKRNIFQESLILTGAVSINEAQQLSLKSSLISPGNYPDFGEATAIISSLVEKNTPQTETSVNNQIVIKKYLYQEIFAILTQKREAISYLKSIV